MREMGKGFIAFALAVVLTLVLYLPAHAANRERDEDHDTNIRRIEMVFASTTVRVNQNRTLYVEIIPHTAEDRVIYWSTSNPEVALVDQDGVVTGVSPGTAEITATSGNGKTAVCTVTVPGRILTGIEQEAPNKDHPTADVDAGERLSAATLRLDVENAVSRTAKNEAVVVTYEGKTVVTTTALRSGAFASQYQGRDVTLKFWSRDGTGAIAGQLTIDPKLAGDGDEDIRVGVVTDPSKTAAAGASARQSFGKAVCVIQLAQQGSYGMNVRVAAKVDLSALGAGPLALYYYDSSANAYALLPEQDYRIDDNGYLHFTTGRGGAIVVTTRT